MIALTKTFWVVLLAVALTACNGGDNGEPEKSAEQLAIEKLAGTSGSETWTVSNGGSVSKDGSLQSADFADFEIRFISNNTGKTYITQNSNLLFDNNGNWAFEGENFDKITLSGIQPAANKEISFTRSQNRLRLEWTVPAPQNARVTGLVGFYVFDLVLLE
ncbi:hypothetical protein SAMN05192553_103495 [Cyclobacterium xiamenense]|uniref:Lipocalin-like domain-containing protein n=1 Tax=Cyclobacterium xiamenense TaxID=1297121 RepID=A0A1H6YIT4_9BACT|nr:hypothetical protein [Cyclobacterium xiamenense]SEJ36645.1 hypothetical protein SAMN05192553_103495 [Cyclobacterium xiamenense]